MSLHARQPVALLLIAFMALLPLQGVLATWSGSPAAKVCSDHQMANNGQQGQHQDHQATDSCCPSNQKNGPHSNGHQCDNSCKQCGAGGCAMALPIIAQGTLPLLRHTTDRITLAGQPQHGRTSLFRPPRTSL